MNAVERLEHELGKLEASMVATRLERDKLRDELARAEEFKEVQRTALFKSTQDKLRLEAENARLLAAVRDRESEALASHADLDEIRAVLRDFLSRHVLGTVDAARATMALQESDAPHLTSRPSPLAGDPTKEGNGT